MKVALIVAIAIGVVGCREGVPHTEEAASSADAPAGASVPNSRAADVGTMPESAAAGFQEIDAIPAEAYPGIPERVRSDLRRRGCRIPQSWHSSSMPHNVIRGEFAAPGQADWAVLCAIGDSSGIVIAWGGTSRCPSSIAWSANRNWFQDVGNGRIAFSRAIGAASQQQIARQAAAYGGPPPPSRDHAGIEDAFVEKASTVWYCHAGAWVSLQGAD